MIAINIQIDELEAKRIIKEYIEKMFLQAAIKMEDIKFEVKSKQNFKSEWEDATFRVKYGKEHK